MKALSIRQPWAWAILHAGKRVENRDWQHTPRWMVGQSICLHASKGCTREEHYEAVESILRVPGVDHLAAHRALLDETSKGYRPALTLPRGAIVGKARVVDVVQTDADGHRWHTTSRNSVAYCQRCTLYPDQCDGPCPFADPWAVPGSLGILLADVVPLATPVPFKGALGFFEVPAGLVEP